MMIHFETLTFISIFCSFAQGLETVSCYNRASAPFTMDNTLVLHPRGFATSECYLQAVNDSMGIEFKIVRLDLTGTDTRCPTLTISKYSHVVFLEYNEELSDLQHVFVANCSNYKNFTSQVIRMENPGYKLVVEYHPYSTDIPDQPYVLSFESVYGKMDSTQLEYSPTDNPPITKVISIPIIIIIIVIIVLCIIVTIVIGLVFWKRKQLCHTRSLHVNIYGNEEVKFRGSKESSVSREPSIYDELTSVHDEYGGTRKYSNVDEVYHQPNAEEEAVRLISSHVNFDETKQPSRESSFNMPIVNENKTLSCVTSDELEVNNDTRVSVHVHEEDEKRKYSNAKESICQPSTEQKATNVEIRDTMQPTSAAQYMSFSRMATDDPTSVSADEHDKTAVSPYVNEMTPLSSFAPKVYESIKEE